jgi:hypothetical protein
MANYIQAIKTKLVGQRDIELSDLQVYISSPVAIGEHPDIGVDFPKKIEKIDDLESKIETINKYFSSSQPTQTADTSEEVDSQQ